MNLTTEDARLFFKLYFALLAYTNRQLKITPKVSAPIDIPKAGGDALMKIRDALYADSELLVRFNEENPERFTPEELNMIANWKHRVSGEFYLMRYLKKYCIGQSDFEHGRLSEQSNSSCEFVGRQPG